MKKQSFITTLILLSAVIFIFVIIKGLAIADGYMPPVTNPKYKQECGSCHWAFLPGLLPERSWLKLMDGLEKHFGEDASLEPVDKREIKRYLSKNAADHLNAKRSRKIARSIPANKIPIRITETPNIINEHKEITPETYERKNIRTFSNCAACHPTANQGSFSDDYVRIPGDKRMSRLIGGAKKKISMIEAINIITKKYAGDVIEVEMERGFYEIIIQEKHGKKRKFYINSEKGVILTEKSERYNDD